MRCVIPQIVAVLQDIDAQHQQERIGLIPASTLLVVVRFHQLGEISPWYDPVDLFEKFFLVRLCFLQLVAQEGHVQLFVHENSIPQIGRNVQPLFAFLFCAGLPKHYNEIKTKFPCKNEITLDAFRYSCYNHGGR